MVVTVLSELVSEHCRLASEGAVTVVNAVCPDARSRDYMSIPLGRQESRRGCTAHA